MILQALKSARKCWVTGHRGAMEYAPENTASSFKEGLRRGADALECDVHLSKDGQCVVMHDESVERTTNGQGLVSQLKAAQIKKLDGGSWFSKKFKGEKIWLLQDLLRWAWRQKTVQGNPLCVVIEVKNEPVRYLQIEKKILDCVVKCKMKNRIVIISFDHGVVKRMKQLDSEFFSRILYDRPLADPMARAKQMSADAIFPRRNLISKKLVERARSQKLFIGTWTVNEPKEMKKILRMKPDMITSNVPDRLIQHFD